MSYTKLLARFKGASPKPFEEGMFEISAPNAPADLRSRHRGQRTLRGE